MAAESKAYRPSMRDRVRALAALTAAGAGSVALPGTARAADAAAPGTAATAGGTLSVGAGETYVVGTTTALTALTLAEGGTLAAPDGYGLTLTVDGVETGSVLTATLAPSTTIAPGTYTGDIVLTVAEQNPAAFAGVTFALRQALYVAADGVVAAKSAASALAGGTVTDTAAQGVSVTSTGEAFDGFYVAEGASYTVTDTVIGFTGNGRCDFVGDGAALVGTGSGTRLVLDGVTVSTEGVERSGLVAGDGANVVVKNSAVRCLNGVLPSDYVFAGGANMLVVPWRLGISGNVRATNLLGTGTRATYLNSTIASETWGAFSTDSVSGAQATAINCTISNLGDEGYGSFADGDVTERILGCTLDVGTYATVIGASDSTLYYGDSTGEDVARLNTDLELGLSDDELAALPVRSTTVTSRQFGVMWHGAGTLHITGGTILSTAATTFLDKAVRATITVDGSQGAALDPGNGVILQVMETDNPGSNDGVYTEPTDDPEKDDSWDVSAAHDTDTTAAFTDIALTGDFYNAMRTGRNMVLAFTGSRVTGVLSASESRHAVDTITSAEYAQLGHVTNTAQPVVNNGVVVTLDGGSQWTVTAASYLSRLTLSADSTVTAPAGSTVSMTVDGEPAAIEPGGDYSGAITIGVG
ncbi:hypothetical protein ACIRQQ_33860 [Streptomyces fuscichromogenes]|uniref:hypothetical protein n=1 Tax=Streptomyces fuscichromogenes TaxID=1324013 RepID=UPI00382C807A